MFMLRYPIPQPASTPAGVVLHRGGAGWVLNHPIVHPKRGIE